MYIAEGTTYGKRDMGAPPQIFHNVNSLSGKNGKKHITKVLVIRSYALVVKPLKAFWNFGHP